MHQGPLFRRSPFAPLSSSQSTDAGTVEYLRLQAHSANPGALLAGQTLSFTAGGMLDVVSEAHGNLGLGNVTYTPGLRAALKRSGGLFTYRFQLPRTAAKGTRYTVTSHGHDRLPAFHFTVEVA